MDRIEQHPILTRLTELTSAETAAMIAAGDNPLALMMTGAVEQHGPRLPLGTDSLIAEALTARIEQKLLGTAASISGPLFLLPPLSVGCSIEHEGYAGTLSLRTLTLEHFMLDICSSLSSFGIRRLLIINTHGGNTHTLLGMLRTLRKETGVMCFLHDIYSSPDLAPYGKRFDYHAGEAETSLMMVARPELVRKHRGAVTDAADSCQHELLKLDRRAAAPWYTRDVSQDGVIGDAAGAAPEIGAELLERMSSSLLTIIKEIQQYGRPDMH
jgi:creatinine amidohydrolase